MKITASSFTLSQTNTALGKVEGRPEMCVLYNSTTKPLHLCLYKWQSIYGQQWIVTIQEKYYSTDIQCHSKKEIFICGPLNCLWKYKAFLLKHRRDTEKKWKCLSLALHF